MNLIDLINWLSVVNTEWMVFQKKMAQFLFFLNNIFLLPNTIGNKADCPDREVKREDGERLAREYNVTFMETSAKTGLNVDLAFLAVAR